MTQVEFPSNLFPVAWQFANNHFGRALQGKTVGTLAGDEKKSISSNLKKIVGAEHITF